MGSLIAPRTIVQAFLPAEGAVALDLIYDTANRAQVADQPVRLTLRRMVAAGQITQDGRGRKGTIQLTPAGQAQLRRDRLSLQLAIAQDHQLAPWDGWWRLLAVSTPESQRATRDGLRRRLMDSGAALASTGLYVTPHDLLPLLSDFAHDHDGEESGQPVVDQPSPHSVPATKHLVQASAKELNVRGVSEPVAVAELLWPSGPISARYLGLEDAIDAAQVRAKVSTDLLIVKQLMLAQAITQALTADPLIPPELRPGEWAPSKTRLRWYDTWQQLTDRIGSEVLFRGWQSNLTSRPKTPAG